jgi:alpha-beta hydrolase superfamily lysophospholipase
MGMDARCWSTFFLEHVAAAGFACYALSLRGHEPERGLRVLHWARIRHYADDVAEVVASLPRPPVLIGHSMGAHVVQKYLEGHTIPAAVLMAPGPPHGGWQTARRMIRMHAPGILRDLFLLRRNVLYPTAAQVRAQCFSADAPETLVEEVLGQLHMESPRALLDSLLLDLPRPPQDAPPMLVMGGDADSLVSVKEFRKTARVLGAEVAVFPGMAHNLMQDVGWQNVAARIMDWLREVVE